MDKFIEYISESKSKNTVQAYKKDVEQFLEYFKYKKISFFNKQDVEEYKDYLLNIRNLNINSINRKLVAIHEFFMFYNQSIFIKKIKTQTQNFLNNILSPTDILNILKVANNQNDYRAIALINTLELTGMRVSEVLQLKIYDINKDTINIIGKGEKRRDIFIPEKLHIIWQEYLKYRIKKTSYLFTGRKGAITRSTVYRIVQKYGLLANIDKNKLHPHNLRHYYCKALANKKVRIDVIADLVGHININTTRIYTKQTKEELLDIINNI